MARGKKKANVIELPDMTAALDEATAGLAQIVACGPEHADVLREMRPRLDVAIEALAVQELEMAEKAREAVRARFTPVRDALVACKKAIEEKIGVAS